MNNQVNLFSPKPEFIILVQNVEMEKEDIKIIQLVHHDFEDLELWYPVYRLREYGATVHLVGETANTTYIGKHGVPATSDYAFPDVNVDLYHGLLIPGGWAPDKLRRFDAVLNMVKHMENEKKPIGAICHAGWVLASAGVLEGKKVTSTIGIKDDMTNAGAEWINEPAVTDGRLVTSQKPPDLPQYLKHLIAAIDEYLAEFQQSAT